jgi:hypothetical protein
VIRALALGTLLALPAAAHPLDRFVAASEGAEVVVIIPRLAHITEPLAATLRRMRQVPALKAPWGAKRRCPGACSIPTFSEKTESIRRVRSPTPRWRRGRCCGCQ